VKVVASQKPKAAAAPKGKVKAAPKNSANSKAAGRLVGKKRALSKGSKKGGQPTKALKVVTNDV